MDETVQCLNALEAYLDRSNTVQSTVKVFTVSGAPIIMLDNISELPSEDMVQCLRDHESNWLQQSEDNSVNPSDNNEKEMINDETQLSDDIEYCANTNLYRIWECPEYLLPRIADPAETAHSSPTLAVATPGATSKCLIFVVTCTLRIQHNYALDFAVWLCSKFRYSLRAVVSDVLAY